MWNKIQSSLIGQIRLLFFVSFIVIVSLWGYFYMRQKHLQDEHAMARYFSLASSLQPTLLQSYTLNDEDLREYNVKNFTQPLNKDTKILFHKGDDLKGFTLFEKNHKRILYVYNPIAHVYLEDLEKDYTQSLLHTIFLALIVIQSILFAASQKLLRPILELEQKLKEVQKGDLSRLSIHSSYKEITQIQTSYNHAVDYINYLLQTREMFNKIFMHELKTPLAKGMFYLKNEPSAKSHADIKKVFETINTQLDTFRTLEELIAYQGEIPTEHHCVSMLLDQAIQTLHVKDFESIQRHQCEEFHIQGNDVLWKICFKNIIDNALRYSNDHSITITCDHNTITFSNDGEPLPLDILQPLCDWKIERTKKHRSTSGYGFGLFIIKNIIELHGYTLAYRYENHQLFLSIHK